MAKENLVVPPDQPWTGAQPKKSWLARNAVWLIIVTILLLVCAGFTCIGGVIWSAMGAIRDHPASVSARERAQADPRVVAILGTPIEAGYLVQAQYNSSGGTTVMTLTCPISGPKAEGELAFAATQNPDSTWTYTRLTVTISNGGSVIDLLAPAVPVPEEVAPVPGTP